MESLKKAVLCKLNEGKGSFLYVFLCILIICLVLLGYFAFIKKEKVNKVNDDKGYDDSGIRELAVDNSER